MTESLPSVPASVAVVGEPHRGLRLGRYELQAPIASGGMAHVWVARLSANFGFQRVVAIKMIRNELAADSNIRRMFVDEARLAGRIRHPHVVEVLDVGIEDSIVFQVMELVEGMSLRRLTERWKARHASALPAAIAVRIVADALRGLHGAHEVTDDNGHALGLVHRDVSPHNILIGGDGVAKIADFGIAKALGRLSDETEVGQLKGKLSYMAPEQLSRGSIDRRSDVFAAGVVLWESLTGARLFRGADVLDTAERVRHLAIVDPRELVPTVPSRVAEVTMRALERKPERRFETAAEMADALEAAMSAAPRKEIVELVEALNAEVTPPGQAIEVPAQQPADVSMSRGRIAPLKMWIAVTVAAGAVAAGALTVGTSALHPESPTPERTLAEPVLLPPAEVAAVGDDVPTRAASMSVATAEAVPITSSPSRTVATPARTRRPPASTKAPSSPSERARPSATSPTKVTTSPSAERPKVRFDNPYGP